MWCRAINSSRADDGPLKPIEMPNRKPAVRAKNRSGSRGQGYQHDAAKKKAIELRAMAVARDHYQGLGYKLQDTSANCPYDYECKIGSKTLRVEVKGLSGSLGDVTVSKNEVIDARSNECATDLFVVYSIALVEVREKGYEGTGGEKYIEENWAPEESKLTATEYRYSIQVTATPDR